MPMIGSSASHGEGVVCPSGAPQQPSSKERAGAPRGRGRGARSAAGGARPLPTSPPLTDDARSARRNFSELY
ncbi:hypothetical protein JYU34_000818 [Plutella xylostella]|uniref:Uncharacterized protein n=1 Tax=Plutella xylostella TaxID=51655 RepID=A0ABQ7R8M1_PLUXY|nr:hypothetical protein JYU34_000818 [Plutella xylostella]